MSSRVYPADAVAGAPSNTGRALRQTAVAPFVAMGSAARPLGAKSGIRVGTPSSIVSVTPTTWTVTPFAGVIDGEALAIAGPYTYSFDTNQTGSVTAAGASARVDRLDVQVSDPAESDGSSNPGAQIVYTAGGPGLAAAPARSHALAQINVPISGGGSPTVSWAPAWSSDSGEWQFNTYAELTAYTTLIGSTNVPPQQQATVIADTAAANNGSYVFSGALPWVRLFSGTNMVVPTSVTGGTVSANGAVSFTTAAAISVNGVFSTLFDNYLVLLDIYTSSTAAGGTLQLRAAGTNAGGTDYAYQTAWDSGTTLSANAASGGASIGVVPVVASEQSSEIRFFGPALARPTRIKVDAEQVVSPSAMVSSRTTGRHGLSTAYDGFTYTPSAGTVTGTVRVYGYYNG